VGVNLVGPGETGPGVRVTLQQRNDEDSVQVTAIQVR